jgi:hypothetical protein
MVFLIKKQYKNNDGKIEADTGVFPSGKSRSGHSANFFCVQIFCCFFSVKLSSWGREG